MVYVGEEGHARFGVRRDSRPLKKSPQQLSYLNKYNVRLCPGVSE